MDLRPAGLGDESPTTPSLEVAEPPRRGLRVPTGGARILLLIALGVVAFIVALDQVTSSPWLCGSCHEMAPRTAQWRQSGHASVRCVDCHISPHAWYAFPQAMVEKGALLARDMGAHATIGAGAVIDERGPGAKPMSQAVCLQCHDVNRKATSGFRILIDHPKHAKRNGSCVSCHVRTAHPKPSRGKALSLMGQCFTCHGTKAKPRASATCRLCHPADFELKPVSHVTPAGAWKRGHGKVALTDPRQCEMCHQRKFCDGCHGMPMPHPKGWAQRTGHPVSARKGRAVCIRCHTDKPDFCSMCHHKAFDPSKGTWVKQHFLEVQKRGAAFCLDCHSPIYCSRCHVGPQPSL